MTTSKKQMFLMIFSLRHKPLQMTAGKKTFKFCLDENVLLFMFFVKWWTKHACFYSSLFHKHIFSHPSKHLPLSFTYKQVHTKGLSPPPWWPPPLLVTQFGTCFLSHWIPIVFSSIHKAQLRQWVHSVFGPRLKLVRAGYCRARDKYAWKVNRSSPLDTGLVFRLRNEEAM